MHAETRQPYYWDNYRDPSLGRYQFRHEHTFIKQSLSFMPWPVIVLTISTTTSFCRSVTACCAMAAC
jgi:hypothetical protein